MNINADLQIVSAGLRGYVFRVEDKRLVQCRANLKQFEIWVKQKCWNGADVCVSVLEDLKV